MSIKTVPSKVIILVSEFPPGPGGIGNQAYNLCKWLDQKGYIVSICTDSRHGLSKEEVEFDENQRFKVIRSKRASGKLVGLFSRIVQFFKTVYESKEYGIVIASGKFPLWFSAIAKFFIPKRKYIAILHGSEVNFPGSWQRRLTAWSIGRFDKLIAVSNFTKQLALKLNPNITINVIPNGFDVQKMEFQTNWKSEGEPALITVGNVTFRKGQQNVIKALPETLEANPNTLYHVVGLPTQKGEMEALAKELGVEKKVVFHGAVSDFEMVEKLKGSSIFCMLSDHLSNGDVEGFGIAILEANAVGLPAIGSNNSGVVDAISDKYSGRLIDPHDSEAFKAAVSEILLNYSTYSSNAEKWAYEFQWAKIISKYIEVIDS